MPGVADTSMLNAKAFATRVRDVARIMDMLARIAPTNAPVLLLGRRGSGLELLVKAIHDNSSRAAGPLATLHCGLYPKRTLEAQFFGRPNCGRAYIRTAHEKFPGRIEAADGGTLYIDQVQNSSPRIQVELLSLLQEHAYTDPTEHTTCPADVRLVVSARPSLEKRANAGLFRADLFSRLNVVPIHLPRTLYACESIFEALEFLRAKVAQENRRPIFSILTPMVEALRSCRWPPAVHALERTLHQAQLQLPQHALPQEILNAGLSLWIQQSQIESVASQLPQTPVIMASTKPAETLGGRVYDTIALRLQQLLIQRTLAQCNGIPARAAELLGIPLKGLEAKIRELGLSLSPLSAV